MSATYRTVSILGYDQPMGSSLLVSHCLIEHTTHTHTLRHARTLTSISSYLKLRRKSVLRAIGPHFEVLVPHIKVNMPRFSKQLLPSSNRTSAPALETLDWAGLWSCGLRKVLNLLFSLFETERLTKNNNYTGLRVWLSWRDTCFACMRPQV